MRRLLCVLLAITTGLVANLVNAKAYKGAEIYSSNSYLYGRYEIRMRVANASGVLSTFFTYKNGSEIGNTFWEEIDIEVFGKNNATEWQSNIILGSSRPTINTEQTHTANASLADDYHTYVVEWTPDYVAWFLDGVEVRRIIGTSTVTSLTNPQTVRFNIWSSESVPWVGAWDDSVLPVYQFVNYIEYKTYNTTSKTFEAGWRDDFNSFDTGRWGKGNWSFDTNRVDFAPENALVKDGILVLALTKENATGFSGTPPTDTPASSSSASSIAVSSNAASSVAVSSSAASASAISSTGASSSTASSIAASVAASSVAVSSSTTSAIAISSTAASSINASSIAASVAASSVAVSSSTTSATAISSTAASSIAVSSEAASVAASSVAAATSSVAASKAAGGGSGGGGALNYGWLFILSGFAFMRAFSAGSSRQ